MIAFTESVVEEAALAWLESLNWRIISGSDITIGELASERNDYDKVILPHRLHYALTFLNLSLPADALEDVYHKATHPAHHALIASYACRRRECQI